jgi:hypothetical protein
MKSVGKQLQEARQARNWTPELAAPETKIKVDRLRDLESDDYTHFSSPTYARGFVRTYARALGLDEYKILRQLDTKLPEDETSSFGADTGIPYVPEPSKTSLAGDGNNAGLYVLLSLGMGVLVVISIILFEAYRAGVLPSYFAENSTTEQGAATNEAPVTAEGAAGRAERLDRCQSARRRCAAARPAGRPEHPERVRRYPSARGRRNDHTAPGFAGRSQRTGRRERAHRKCARGRRARHGRSGHAAQGIAG